MYSCKRVLPAIHIDGSRLHRKNLHLNVNESGKEVPGVVGHLVGRAIIIAIVNVARSGEICENIVLMVFVVEYTDSASCHV